MPVPKAGITLYDGTGNRRDLDEVIAEVRQLPGRLVVDDDLSVVVDLAGLGFQTTSMDWKSGKLKRADVSLLHKRKRKAKILRITVAAGVAVDVAEDTLFHVRDVGGAIRHVRADMLKPGMEIIGADRDDGTPGFIIY